MIDIIYLAHNRRAFTEASLAALRANTDWSQVRRALLYDDSSTDGTRELIEEAQMPVETIAVLGKFGSPVSVMNDYLCSIDPFTSGIFAKIDSDTMVPPNWLNACLQVMDENRNLDLLGIEAHMKLETGNVRRGYESARFIGGIGLMRQESFITLPRPSGRFGFGAYQARAHRADAAPIGWVTPGWIKPALPVFLLDRLPREPWVSLSLEYEAAGWQRPWPKYGEESQALWSWWCD